MDQLAEEHYSFINAHCPAPVCGPSRTAILTGMQPVTTGIYDNNIKFSRDLPKVISLPEHFRKNNYKVFEWVNYSMEEALMFQNQPLMNMGKKDQQHHLHLLICRSVNKTLFTK